VTAGGPDVPLPYSSEAHQRADQFLVEEAYLLDGHRYEDWLDLLCPDIRYLMPVAVTTARGAAESGRPPMAHLDEDLFSLRRRAHRLATEHAWTEDPPSRLRHFVTNVRTFEGPGTGELSVESYVLLFRSRGDTRDAELLSAGRSDVLRLEEDGRCRLARRTVHVDEAVLRTQNLAILL
jgi:phthalate 3,4-dioxygenase subunit beta